LKFAEDLVVKWLMKYKFKKWNETETRKIPVTEDMKEKRATEIAEELINHSKWRSHGRSIKIGDLEGIGLKIKKVEDDPKLADTVYRIQTVCRLLFESSSIFKIFATAENKLFKQATPKRSNTNSDSKNVSADVVEIQQECPKCKKVHSLYGKFSSNPKIDQDLKNKGLISFPKDAKIKCDNCGLK